MKKDKLYFLTFLSIAGVFLLVALFASTYFVRASASQLLEVQVESSKREVNEMADLLFFQLNSNIEKTTVLENLQTVTTNSVTDSWYISVFDWSGKLVVNPDKTKVGQIVKSNEDLLNTLKENNYSSDLYDLLLAGNETGSEIIYIAPVKNSDLIVAANVNINNLKSQLRSLRNNFYLILLLMGVFVIILSFLAVRSIGSIYEKQLEQRNTNLTTEVVNLSKLNTDLVSYKEKVAEKPKDLPQETQKETEKKRLLTYVRNELVPVAIDDIAYVYTENTITYIIGFDGKRSTSNMSLDDIYNKLNESLFFRANRQYIISITAIDKIIKYGKSQLKIILQADTTEEIIISKNKAAEFKQWLNM